jgi:hypothetical protein
MIYHCGTQLHLSEHDHPFIWKSPLFRVSVICGAWTGDLPKTQTLEGRRLFFDTDRLWMPMEMPYEARDKTTLRTNPEDLLCSFMKLHDRDELAKILQVFWHHLLLWEWNDFTR